SPPQTIEYFHYLGALALKRGLGTDAETYFQQASELANKHEIRWQLQNKEDFANYFIAIGNYAAAEQLLLENLAYFTERDELYAKSLTGLQLAYVKIYQEQYSDASSFLEKSQTEMIQSANKYDMVRYYQYLSRLLIQWQKGDPEDYLDLALVVARERQFRELIAHLLLLKGKVGILKRGNNFESMGYLEGALFYTQELELNELYPEVYHEMALLYESFEEYSTMETYLNMASQSLLRNVKNYPISARASYLSRSLRKQLEADLKRCQEILTLDQKTPQENSSSPLEEDSTLDDLFLVDARLFDDNPSYTQDVEGSQAFLSEIKVAVSKHPNERNYEDLLKIILINQKLNQEYNQKNLMEFIMDMMIEVSHAERGFLVLSLKGKHVIKVARNIDREELKKADMKVSQTILQKMFRTGKEVVLDNAMEEEDFKGNQSVFRQKLRSVLCVPFTIKNRMVGGVYLDNRFLPGVFNQQTVFHVHLLATQAAIALENTKLYRELQARQIKLESYTKEIKKLNKQLQGQLQVQQDELSEVKQQLSLHQEALETKYNYQDIVAFSPKMQQLLKALDKVIDSRLPVLIQGESGTGKELIAKAIHYNGPRKKANFVSINCAALPEPLLESELFGHKRGAFTGATDDKKGLFELAGEGTIFLDEVGDMPLSMQTKILRVLQEGEIRPVGGK
ncbi:MAG: sigma 54-interacting transcriptional regulator, partial [Planctomycetota bacterium]